MRRVVAYGVSFALIVLAVAPVFREPWSGDSFPFSTYPMFSRTRPRQMYVVHAVAVHEDGRRVPVPPDIVAGTSEVLQAAAVVSRAIRAGPEQRARLCRRIAEQAREEPALRRATAIELSTDLFDTVAYFERGPEPIRRRVRARCEVGAR